MVRNNLRDAESTRMVKILEYTGGQWFIGLSLKPDVTITAVAHLLAYVTGLVNQELLLKNEHLLAENLILKAHLQPSFRLSRSERTTLAEIGKRLGRKVRRQWTASDARATAGERRDRESGGSAGARKRRLGYDRIVGALANLGY
jgi:putative transposase